MPNFIKFRNAVNAQIKKMENEESGLLLTSIDKDNIWDTYLNSFTEGSDPLFMVNSTHNCNCCKAFIRDLGSVVAISNDNKIMTCWDINIDDVVYQQVADALANYVRGCSIESLYKSSSLSLHVKDNKAMKGDALLTFDHFYYKLSEKYTSTINRGDAMGKSKSHFNVLTRALNEITIDAIDTVLMLIDDNSLYLGEQNRRSVADFLKVKREFDNLDDNTKVNFVWRNVVVSHPSVRTIRNSAIGTLLINLSEDIMSVDSAVSAYESIVAPGNYKRSKTIVTKKMIESAQSTVKKLGFEKSLFRRHASLDDITINNVIWADKDTSAKLVNGDVFDDLITQVSTSKVPTKGTTINLLEFVDKIVPIAKSIEIYLENKHQSNMMSLIAPEHDDAPSMLKWDNNFTWSYQGNVTDSVKQRVKSKGGNIDGDLRVSLSWFNKDDLDIHMKTPYGTLYYNNKSTCGLKLDVDENVSATNAITNAVENISCNDRSNLVEGEYSVLINNFTFRDAENAGFEVEIEYLGNIETFISSHSPSSGGYIDCFTFRYSHDKGIKIVSNNLEQNNTSKELWNLNTSKYHNVSSIMWSPNHWDNNNTGNRHLFFMLNNCKNPEPVRGFYNEYLTESLHKDRKVFEVLAGKMKAEPTDEQLSGLGFSTTAMHLVH